MVVSGLLFMPQMFPLEILRVTLVDAQVHGDAKPENILCTATSTRCAILDFGWVGEGLLDVWMPFNAVN